MKLSELLELMSAFDKSNLTSVSFETEGAKIRLEKAAPTAAAPAAIPTAPVVAAPVVSAAPVPPAAPVSDGTAVTAPIVGVVYCASAPGKTPYVSVGQTVKKGDVVCLIEAMKTINEVKAPCGGVVKEILFTDGELKEFGAPLVVIGENA